MIVEIYGCSTRNKGAELMLAAIREHMRAEMADTQLAVSSTFGGWADRARYGLLTVIRTHRIGRSWLAMRLMPGSCRRMLGAVREEEIDAVLDASGFAFGDQHGPLPTESMASHVVRWKRQGKSIVLLPQAFGPFTGERIRSAMTLVLQHSDLVYARDEISLQALKELEAGNVHLAPDITTQIKGRVPDDFKVQPGRIAIVPNARMLDKTDAPTAEGYAPFLVRCLEAALEQGLLPFLLLHDATEDIGIARKVNLLMGADVPVVQHQDPVLLKGVLGHVDLVIASRYHALVGSLSQGIPSVGVGWSHKYGALLAPYGNLGRLVPTATPKTEMAKIIADMIRIPRGNSVSRSDFCVQQASQLAQMWKAVDQLLSR